MLRKIHRWKAPLRSFNGIGAAVKYDNGGEKIHEAYPVQLVLNRLLKDKTTEQNLCSKPPSQSIADFFAEQRNVKSTPRFWGCFRCRKRKNGLRDSRDGHLEARFT